MRNRRDPTRSMTLHRYQDVMSAVQGVAADFRRRLNSMVPPMATCPVPVPPVRPQHNKRIRTVRNNNREKCRVFNRSVKFVFTKR